jgi:prepilin-type N-terminal cleavage/methylation domain-containing protein
MKNLKRTDRGFSLMELLVVLSIFLIITSVVLFNQNKMSSDIGLSNVTYEVALKIRQTQTYGILVKGNEDEFDAAYGVHFYKDNGDTIRFKIFADNPNSVDDDDLLRYNDSNDSNSDTELSDHSLEEGNIIKDVCTYDSVGGTVGECLIDNNFESADIVFKRPETAAIISNSSSWPEKKSEIHIEVTSALGDKSRIIKVFGSGQISVYAN